MIKIENLGDTFFYTKESFKNLPAWIRAQSEFADNPNQEHDKISRRQWKELSKNLGGMLNSGSDAMALGVGRISGEMVLTIKPGAVLYGSVSEITQRYEDLKEEVRNSANLVTSIGLAKGMEVVGKTKALQNAKQEITKGLGKGKKFVEKIRSNNQIISKPLELDYTLPTGQNASDVRNMTLNEFKNIGVRGNNKNIRILNGNFNDAEQFFYSRVTEIKEMREILDNEVKKGSLIIGYDKYGNKLSLRDFSSSGGHPTIDVFSSTGKKTVEIKFKER